MGRFNEHLEHTIALVSEEAFIPEHRSHASALKSLITEPTLTVERKGGAVRTVRNHLRLVLCTNEEHAVAASMDERRFLVLEVNPQRAQDIEYFAALCRQMDEKGGLAAMLYDLQRRAYDRDRLRTVPKTAALAKQKIASLDDPFRWWLGKLESGELLPGTGCWGEIEKKVLAKDYLTAMRRARHCIESEDAASIELGKLLREKIFKAGGLKEDRGRPANARTPLLPGGGARPRTYLFPPVAECRAIWDRYMGVATAWPNDEPAAPRSTRVASVAKFPAPAATKGEG